MKDLPRRLSEAARLWIEAGGGQLPVAGTSMQPTFEDRSRVWMERVDRVRFGDVVVFLNDELLVVHRVVGLRRGACYRTKGDGLAHLDPGFVSAANVLGRVVEIERDGSRRRCDGGGGRLYATLAGLLSAVEGFFYRFAYRLDRILTPPWHSEARHGGRTTLRRWLRGCGRLGFRILDRLLFDSLNKAR